MNAKKVLAYLALTALLVAVADLGSTWALSGRRKAMRQLAGELRRGMTRAEVEEVISREPTEMFSRTANGDGIRLSTAVDWVHTWTVSIVFEHDRLARVIPRTEDGGSPKGVPSIQ